MGLIVVGPATAGFLPSRATMGSGSAALTTTRTKVAGWVADTSGFPGSSVVNNELLVQGGRSGVTLDASVVWTNSSTIRTVTMWLVLDGVDVTSSSGSATAFTSSTLTISAAGQTVAAGQRLWLEASVNTGTSVTANSNAASFLRIYVP